MSFPRFVPKRLFQLIALFLLFICLGVTGYWIVTNTGLYHFLRQQLPWMPMALTMLLTFLGLFIGWLIIVLPLRWMSQMPTLREELGQDWATGFKRVYETEKAKNEELYRTADYTPEMKRRARQLGAIFILVGGGLGIAAVLSFVASWEYGRLYRFQIYLAVIAVALIVAGLIQLVTGKSVVRKRP